MDTSKDLVALLKNLSEGIDKNDFDDYNESQVSQQFVIPILEKLGWDIKNAKEVYPQFEVGDGKRVDYVLLSNGRPKKWQYLIKCVSFQSLIKNILKVQLI